MKSGRVSIVVAAWNLRPHVRECLGSVERETRGRAYEVVVVDNGSTDGTSDMVVREFPQAVLIRNTGNLGFVRASNLGLRRAIEEGRSKYVLLLNADVVIRDGAIDRLAEYLDAHPQVGAAGPALVLPEGGFQPGPAGFRPTVGAALAHFLFLSKFIPLGTRPLFVDPAVLAGWSGGRPVRVDWLSGACLMVEAEVVRHVGLLDENYFLYVDDIDWGIRMRAAGVALHFLPSIRVTHAHGITSKTVDLGFNTRWLDQLFRYVRKEQGVGAAVLFRLTAVTGFFFRSLLFALQALLPTRHRRARVKVRENLAYAFFCLKSGSSLRGGS